MDREKEIQEKEEEILNLQNPILNGILVIGLILAGTIAPIYIADHWRDIEQSGTSAVDLSSLTRTDTITQNQTFIETFDQFNMTTDVITENPYYNSGAGTICAMYKSTTSITSYLSLTTYNDDYDGYEDCFTWPAGMGYYSGNRVSYNVHFSALEALTNEAGSMRIYWHINVGSTEWAFNMVSIIFGYAVDDTGSSAPQLMGINYATDTGSHTGPTVYWLNLTTDQLNGIATYQNGQPEARKYCQIVFGFAGGGAPYPTPTCYSSFEVYQEYYEIEEGVSHNITDEYDNSTVYVGSDVTVSYFDIQTWILGISGIGIGILALAVSPFWNPTIEGFAIIRDRIPGSRRSRRGSRKSERRFGKRSGSGRRSKRGG